MDLLVQVDTLLVEPNNTTRLSVRH